MIVLGVDIGLTGAIAAVDSAGTCSVHDLPTKAIGGNRQVGRCLDARGLIMIVREIVRPGVAAMAVIENLHAGIGPGKTARASLMHSTGVVEAVLAIARIDTVVVSPVAWKRWHGLLRAPKNEGRLKAIALFPVVTAQLMRKKDHNRADALLLAEYGQKTLR